MEELSNMQLDSSESTKITKIGSIEAKLTKALVGFSK